MTATHTMAREYAEPIEGIPPMTEMLYIECTCGETMQSFCMNRKATPKALADEHASHVALMHEMDTNWTITATAHANCPDCTELKATIVEEFRATRSAEGTVSLEGHSCTATKIAH